MGYRMSCAAGVAFRLGGIVVSAEGYRENGDLVAVSPLDFVQDAGEFGAVGAIGLHEFQIRTILPR